MSMILFELGKRKGEAMSANATPVAACLKSLTLIRYYLKDLKPAAMVKVRKHVARCPKCRAKLLALKIAAEVNAEVRQRRR